MGVWSVLQAGLSFCCLTFIINNNPPIRCWKPGTLLRFAMCKKNCSLSYSVMSPRRAGQDSGHSYLLNYTASSS
ncbi:hypothetical protein BDZ97DRAFT_1787577 [Flammula alnicola]|nr:hypothetical protein BDZ97DRAFT_1787577 [Flammula alnicola]